MIAEILSVGTELLMGQIANTDAQYISRRLGELGVNIYRHTTVGDNPARVKEALGEALKKSLPTVLSSGMILITAGYIIGKRCTVFYISNIGALLARGAAVSVLFVLTLLPALLALLDRFVVREK